MKPWTPLRLALCAAGSLAVLAGFNAVVGRMANNLHPQQLVRRLETAAPGVGVLFLGNSLVEAGAHPAAYAAAAPGSAPFNAGLGATFVSEHCLLLQRALDAGARPRRVIYGFFDEQLTAPVPDGWADLVGNRALSYRYPAEAAELYAPGDPWTRWRLRAVAAIPLLAERYGVWAKVERWKRRLEEIGRPAIRTNQFGRADDFSALEAEDPALLGRRLDATVAGNRPLNLSTETLLRRARASGAEPCLVLMPMTSSHRQRYYETDAWRRYAQHLRRRADGIGARWVDASAWIEDGGFADPLHLSPAGAAEFSARLARELAGGDVPR